MKVLASTVPVVSKFYGTYLGTIFVWFTRKRRS